MAAKILSGRDVAAVVKEEVAARVAALTQQGKTVGLATVLVGEDPASKIYVRNKHRAAERVGMLNRGPGGKAAQVRQAIDKMTKPFSLSELQAECPGVSLPTIKRELGAMKGEGLVMLTGRGRGAKWKRLG